MIRKDLPRRLACSTDNTSPKGERMIETYRKPLWSPAVATGGDRSQTRSPQKRQKQAKPCRGLRPLAESSAW